MVLEKTAKNSRSYDLSTEMGDDDIKNLVTLYLSMVSTLHCSLSVPQDALGGHSSMNGQPKPDHPIAPPIVIAVALFAVVTAADASTK